MKLCRIFGFLFLGFFLVSCSFGTNPISMESEQINLSEQEQLSLSVLEDSQPDLDRLLREFSLPDGAYLGLDLEQDDDLQGIPRKLAEEFAWALCEGQSDRLMEEKNRGDLMISGEDFVFGPNTDESDDLYEEKLRESLQSDSPSMRFYQLDIDGDGTDEILALQNLRYDYSHSNVAFLLKKTGDSYCLAGYDYLGYYRICSVFAYEGKYYLAANYDNYKTRTTKAAGLFLIDGRSSGFMWCLDTSHIYLRKNGDDYRYHLLYENPDHSLTDQVKSYVGEIGTDLIYTDRTDQTFYGMEREDMDGEQQAERLSWRKWNPEGYGVSQTWVREIGGEIVEFTLYRKDFQDLYVLDARICEGERTEVLADYVIDLKVSARVSDYWDYDDSNQIAVAYEDPEGEAAFPDDMWEQAEGLVARRQEEDWGEVCESSVIPEQLLTAMKLALLSKKPHTPELDVTCPEMEPDLFYDTFYQDYPEGREYMADSVYHYCLNQENYYLGVRDTGGTARLVDMDIYKEEEQGKLVHLENWQSLDLDARVIEYEGAFYILESSYNYYSKATDSVTVYCLIPEGLGDYVTISLVPDRYRLKEVYHDGRPWEQEISDYVETVWEELLEYSVISDDIRIFTGDELPVQDDDRAFRLKSVGADYDYWEIDFNNDGKQEYLTRHFWFPSNAFLMFLDTDTYQFTPRRVAEFPNPFYDNCMTLLQLWFKEFHGQVFTFRLFFSSDKFALNVSLIEDSRIRQVQTWVMAPEYKTAVHIGGNTDS